MLTHTDHKYQPMPQFELFQQNGEATYHNIMLNLYINNSNAPTSKNNVPSPASSIEVACCLVWRLVELVGGWINCASYYC